MTHKKKVIYLVEPPTEWSYYDYVHLNNTNPIQEWYDDLPEDIQDIFDGLLKINQKTKQPLQWIGFRKYLKGGDLKKYGVWELEFKGEDTLAHRLMGIFDGAKRAIFLVGCYHKGNNYTPSNALDTAADRAAKYHQKRALIRERKIQTNI